MAAISVREDGVLDGVIKGGIAVGRGPEGLAAVEGGSAGCAAVG